MLGVSKQCPLQNRNSPVSSGYSRLWQRFVSIHLIAKKLQKNTTFGVGVIGNALHR